MNKTVALLLALLAVALSGSLVRAADTTANAASANANVSGTWDAVVETPQGTGTPVLVLRQEGQKLTGQYKGQLGESAITGTIKGNEFSLTFMATSVKVEYTGVVEGGSMKGKAKFGSEADGTFSARRREK